jgi:hypothetical protein
MFALVLSFAAAAVPSEAAPPLKQPIPVVRRDTPALDPVKADAARSVAARLLPTGITRKILNDPLNDKIIVLTHSYLMMPVEQFALAIGIKLPKEGVNGPPEVRVGILTIIDPASRERGDIADKVIREMAGNAAMTEEPRLRNALAIAYSSRLSLDELKALDSFLATPAGAAFARTSAMLENDMDVHAARFMMDRAIAASVPSMLGRLSKETAALPHTKTAAELNPAERKEIARLLQIDQSQLEAHKP